MKIYNKTQQKLFQWRILGNLHKQTIGILADMLAWEALCENDWIDIRSVDETC